MKLLNLKQYLISEIHHLLLQILAILKPYVETNTEIGSMYAKLNPQFEAFNTAMQKKRISDFTEEKKRLDHTQDDAFLCWREYISSCTFQVLHPEFRAPAERIKEAITRHGWSLNNEGYHKQSTASHSLINEIESTGLKADQELIGGQELFVTWKGALADFENVQQEDLLDQSIDKGKSATELRSNIIRWIEKLTQLVDIKNEMEGGTEWLEIKSKLDVLIENTNADIKRRITLQNKKAEMN